MFNPKTADRVIEIEELEAGLLQASTVFDDWAYHGLQSYFRVLFANDAALLASEYYRCNNPSSGEQAARHEDEALELATAYCNYILRRAFGGTGIPDWNLYFAESGDKHLPSREELDSLQEALAIADKLGIDTGEVVQYYRSKVRWMPAPGTLSWEDALDQFWATPAKIEPRERAA